MSIINNVKNSGDGDFKAGESFEAYARRMNSGLPDRTTTIDQKQKAITAKRNIMRHPGCPSNTKTILEREIATIEKEIKTMEREQNMNTSVFDDNKEQA